MSEKVKKQLKNEGVESFGTTCLTCYEDQNENFFSLSCGHQFCADCWEEYLKE